MSDEHSDDQEGLPANTMRPAPSASDERDATIARLERAIADERKHSATLRATIEDLRFKTDILEKSYSKQLADTRLRCEAAERELAEKRARLAALDAGEDTTRLLSEARAELKRVTADRDQLRKQLAAGDGPYTPSTAQDDPEPQVGEGTINAMLANPSWLRERQPAGDSHLDAKVATEDESPTEEMIPPDLVFPVKRDAGGES
jgi:hypothetical protein